MSLEILQVLGEIIGFSFAISQGGFSPNLRSYSEYNQLLRKSWHIDYTGVPLDPPRKNEHMSRANEVRVQLLKTSPSMVTSGWLLSASCTQVEPERPGIHIANGVVPERGAHTGPPDGQPRAPPDKCLCAGGVGPPAQNSHRRHLHHRLPRQTAACN